MFCKNAMQDKQQKMVETLQKNIEWRKKEEKKKILDI